MTQKEIDTKIFDMVKGRTAEITEFYTYGRAFNIMGKVNNIQKDNFESVKLVVTDGLDYEEMYKLNYTFEENNLIFHSDNEINSGLIIDKLENKEYFLLLRVKVNNSSEAKFYTFKNVSNNEALEYYTVTQNEKNRKATICFLEKTNGEQINTYLSIQLNDAELPDDVYDIVIDAGHGGTDVGEKLGNDTEADITLEYAKLLKTQLEEKGLKVKLTRDDNNTKLYNYTNMYDSAGRITVACKSQAKWMISFHVNNGNSQLRGLEIYVPCKCNLDFAQTMAKKIKAYTSISFSNNNSFKKLDGVYEQNFTPTVIQSYINTANKKGYEPYNITTDTPYLYTIREVGGIATNAYVDGRNKEYSKNEYYQSHQGLECYQIELGYIKNDLEIIKNEKEGYVRAITETICDNI